MSIVARLLQDLVTEVKRTAAATSVDAVHDLRVSVRRVTEALRIFEGDLPHARRLRKEIRAIRRHASAVRDRDVTAELLRRERLPVTDPARIYLTGQRDLAAEQLRAILRRVLKKERPRRWFEWIGEES